MDHCYMCLWTYHELIELKKNDMYKKRVGK
jgi:hypothetical protein